MLKLQRVNSLRIAEAAAALMVLYATGGCSRCRLRLRVAVWFVGTGARVSAGRATLARDDKAFPSVEVMAK
jgi:hypothetical protein